jgi:hypothetical protein
LSRRYFQKVSGFNLFFRKKNIMWVCHITRRQ